MRTALRYEVVRGDFNEVTDRGAVLMITLGKKDTVEQADRFLAILSKETGYDFQNGMWEENMYQVGWIEMDRDDFEDVKYDYDNLKKDIKAGTVTLDEVDEEVLEEIKLQETSEEEVFNTCLKLARIYVAEQVTEQAKREVLDKVSMMSYATQDVFNWYCDRLQDQEYEVTHPDYRDRFNSCMKYFDRMVRS